VTRPERDGAKKAMPDLALDLRHWKYAMVVAEHGSFRRAAEALNLSQSTVVRQLINTRIRSESLL